MSLCSFCTIFKNHFQSVSLLTFTSPSSSHSLSNTISRSLSPSSFCICCFYHISLCLTFIAEYDCSYSTQIFLALSLVTFTAFITTSASFTFTVIKFLLNLYVTFFTFKQFSYSLPSCYSSSYSRHFLHFQTHLFKFTLTIVYFILFTIKHTFLIHFHHIRFIIFTTSLSNTLSLIYLHHSFFLSLIFRNTISVTFKHTFFNHYHHNSYPHFQHIT